MSKGSNRIRRATRTRKHIRRLGALRLSVFRTPRHIYAQVFDDAQGKVLVQASTVDKELRPQVSNGGNVDAAKIVGQHLAERALKIGIEQVAFDRGGFRYHGRVKALADSAREHGLKF